MKQLFAFGLITVTFAGLASAQRTVLITPRITGGDSANGKCTIRIMVDNAVNVRIGNGQIRVETLAGQPSRDDGSECTSVLRNGRNLSDFRFRGIDGRGEVRLQSDPRNDNRGEAVVSINDSKGGEEGYTFEVSWSGDNGRGGGFFGGGGNNSSVPYSNNYAGNYDQVTNACMDTVRSRIQRDYNTSNLTFDQVNTTATNNNGNQNRISGTVRSNEGRRGGGNFRYECQVNMKNGNVRNVNVWRN